MNISGIGSYSGSYNSIKINRLFGHETQKAGNNKQIQPSDSENSARLQQEQQIRQKQNFNSEDYAKQYVSGRDYDLKGADSDLTLLDVEKTASNFQKSQIAKQYQLFMGEAQAQRTNRSAMNMRAIRGVENFAF